LIIDQPEGDLDNKIICRSDRLSSQRGSRTASLFLQAITQNIVVNGSSELVGQLDVKDSGERQFECAGAIDPPSICKVITSPWKAGKGLQGSPEKIWIVRP
jgi:type III restriction enzyme